MYESPATQLVHEFDNIDLDTSPSLWQVTLDDQFSTEPFSPFTMAHSSPPQSVIPADFHRQPPPQGGNKKPRRHRCDECSETAFTSKADLRRHRRSIHGDITEGNPLWQCPIDDCDNSGKLWTREDNFKQHLSKVHGETSAAVLEQARTSYDPKLHDKKFIVSNARRGRSARPAEPLACSPRGAFNDGSGLVKHVQKLESSFQSHRQVPSSLDTTLENQYDASVAWHTPARNTSNPTMPASFTSQQYPIAQASQVTWFTPRNRLATMSPVMNDMQDDVVENALDTDQRNQTASLIAEQVYFHARRRFDHNYLSITSNPTESQIEAQPRQLQNPHRESFSEHRSSQSKKRKRSAKDTPRKSGKRCDDSDPETEYKLPAYDSLDDHIDEAAPIQCFACPFDKANHGKVSKGDANHVYPDCRSCLLRDVRALREHLRRFHLQPKHVCPRCFKTFETQETSWAHARGTPCENADPSLFDSKITRKTFDRISMLRGHKPEDVWDQIFSIVQPDSPVPQSQYQENWDPQAAQYFSRIFYDLAPKIINLIHRQASSSGQSAPPLTSVVLSDAFEQFMSKCYHEYAQLSTANATTIDPYLIRRNNVDIYRPGNVVDNSTNFLSGITAYQSSGDYPDNQQSMAFPMTASEATESWYDVGTPHGSQTIASDLSAPPHIDPLSDSTVQDVLLEPGRYYSQPDQQYSPWDDPTQDLLSVGGSLDSSLDNHEHLLRTLETDRQRQLSNMRH